MKKVLLSSARCRAALFAVVCALLLMQGAAASSMRSEMGLNEGWRFCYGGVTGADKPWLDDSDWVAVTLPHTWNATDGADGGDNYARGTGWYRKRFRVDTSWSKRRVFLQFDGASRSAVVMLNGRTIGEHVGAFARFRFDVTDALNFGGENTLVVAVNNADDGVAPITADFTFFGGLYRGVRLFATNPLHIDVLDHASNGVYVTQKTVSRERAELAVHIRVRNDSRRDERLTVRAELLDAGGRRVAHSEDVLVAEEAGDAISEQLLSVVKPRLWQGRRDPYLYTVQVSLLVDGFVRDASVERIGLRDFHIDASQGFFLNGEYLDLHGVCRHQDRAGKGWAISEPDEREDFALIREMGANTIRAAHYQQSALWYDLADEHGMLVWAEIPIVNEVAANARYSENARQQMRELIRQNFNRPAIFCWGIGNETREIGEKMSKEKPGGPAATSLLAGLAALVRAEDPQRLSVYASHHRPEDPKNFHADLLGFNKYIGWYGGSPENFASWIDGVRQKHPDVRLSISEYGAGANPSHHENNPRPPTPGGDWHPEEYQTLFHEAHWTAMRSRAYLWGKYIWNMFDFAADQRSEGDTPGINDKGLVTYDRRTRKDAFYWYKANWSDDPVLHIASRRFTERTEAQTEVKVFSNVREVELFVNGESQGMVASDDRVFRWRIDLAGGRNVLVAVVDGAAGRLRDECVWTLVRPSVTQPTEATAAVVNDALDL